MLGHRITSCLMVVVLGGCSGNDQGQPPAGNTQPGALSVSLSQISKATIAEQVYTSSTQLEAKWQMSSGTVAQYQLLIRETASSKTTEIVVSKDKTSAILTELKAATSYTLLLNACLDESCSQIVDSAESKATTAEEVWQLQGAGNTFDTVATIATDTNVLTSVFRYGAEAGPQLEGHARMMYHVRAHGTDKPNIGATLSATTVNASASTFSQFSEITPGHGLKHPNTPSTLVKRLAAFHAVPMVPDNKIRLFFEAQGADGATRLMYLDSQDGLEGRDFHPGSASVVETQTDYDGIAKPTVIVGIEGDSEAGDQGMTNARQSKMGWPQRDNWAWDGSAGAYMIITGSDACGQTHDGLFMATYDGGSWQVVQDEKGCSRPLVELAHGPVIVHLGQARYKLYFEHRPDKNDKHKKPLHMFYGDGSLSGDTDQVEFADWEGEANSREVHFLWPDGSLLNESKEAGLGDHFVFLPTNDLDVQVMYLNLGGMDDKEAPGPSKGIGVALLVNP
jgi:hypothetical protein